MSARFIIRIVFVIAMALSLSVPFAGTAAACDPEITGHCL
jgi:hypothetical protein